MSNLTNEQTISNFLRTEYTDADLAAALAHAQDGKLSYYSCCCLRGIPSANHALRGARKEEAGFTTEVYGPLDHAKGNDALFDLQLSSKYQQADTAYFNLGDPGFGHSWLAEDALRRSRLIPLIEAEIARRESERASQEAEDAVRA